MVKRATAALLAAAVGVGVALAVSTSHAQPDKAPGSPRLVTFASYTGGTTVAGGILGIVNSIARPNGIIGMLVSLHSLEPDTTYELSGNRKPCSVVDAADYVLWRKQFKTGTDDDAFAKTRTERELPGRVRSVRLGIVFDGGAGNDEVACSRALALQNAVQNESKQPARAP